LTFAAPLLIGLPACEDETDAPAQAATAPDGGAAASDGGAVPHTLFATEGETLVAFDVATGAARTGAIGNLKRPTDLQALDDGHLVVNLTDANEVLLIDGRTFREVTRVKSSTLGGTRPVHGYLSPKRGGQQRWLALNDGDGTAPTNSALFVDVTPGSATFGKAVGEAPLGVGHHKAAFSPDKARVSVSNIADCANVVMVLDYTIVAQPRAVKAWSAAELDPARACTPQMGVGPHGAAAAANGRAYHSLTGWGAILAVHQDEDAPTFKLLPTKGNGAGYAKAGKDGRYVYALQRTPREGDATRPGADCQIGQLVVVDSQSDTLAAEVPIRLGGPDCATKLPAHAVNAGPDRIVFAKDGKTLFVTTQASAPMGSAGPAYSDQVVVFDVSAPAQPTQQASLTVGKHSGHRAMTVSGDGAALFVINGQDGSISHVQLPARTLLRTLPLKAAPGQIATWGSAEGPGAQIGPR
jgi:DNA-binding beta-propeller fold protein YncE